jgi:hypothetical protein
MKATKEQVLAAIDAMRARIEADDSFEGSVSYTIMPDYLERGEFELQAAYRVGNSMGQGGMTIIPLSEDGEQAKHDWDGGDGR